VPRNRSEGPGGGVRGIALIFRDLGCRRGGWSAPRPGRFTRRKDPVPAVQETGWVPGTAGPYIYISYLTKIDVNNTSNRTFISRSLLQLRLQRQLSIKLANCLRARGITHTYKILVRKCGSQKTF
jgi:hypothetical protein